MKTLDLDWKNHLFYGPRENLFESDKKKMKNAGLSSDKRKLYVEKKISHSKSH